MLSAVSYIHQVTVLHPHEEGGLVGSECSFTLSGNGTPIYSYRDLDQELGNEPFTFRITASSTASKCQIGQYRSADLLLNLLIYMAP